MISVCIPTYNGEKYLKQQLDSILVQLEKNDEIIVSDDSSTDSTINLLKSYQDPRIRILQGNLYKNPIFNLENALKHAKGDYIFTADQDDIWKNDKVKQMIQALQKYDLVVSDASIINKMGKLLLTLFLNNIILIKVIGKIYGITIFSDVAWHFEKTVYNIFYLFLKELPCMTFGLDFV